MPHTTFVNLVRLFAPKPPSYPLPCHGAPPSIYQHPRTHPPGTANGTPLPACCMMMVQSRSRKALLLAFPMLASLLVAAVLVGLAQSFVPPASIQQQRRLSYNDINIKHHHAPSAASTRMTAARPLSGSHRLLTSPPGPTTSTAETRTALRSNRPSSAYACVRCAPLLLSRLCSDDHDHDNNDNSSGGRGGGGGGGGRGRGGGRGDGNDDDGGSAGDEGFGDGQPLVLAAAGGSLAAFLDGLKDAMRQFRMPWDRKVKQWLHVGASR